RMLLIEHRTPRRAHISRRLIHRYAIAESRDRTQVVAPRTLVRHVVLERSPQLRVGGENVLELPRQNTDDLIEIIIERYSPSHDRGVGAESSPPQRIADQDHRWTLPNVILGEQVASERWMNAEHVEVARAHPLRVKTLRLLGSSEYRLPLLEQS